MCVCYGCKSEGDIDVDVALHSIYEKYHSIPTYNIGLNDMENTRSLKFGIGIPVLSNQLLDYLSNLSLEELDDLMTSNNLFNKDMLDLYDRLETENIIRIYDILGGRIQYDILQEFMIKYLESPGGINYIEKLIPGKLCEKQVKIYIAMSVYIDNIARPIFQYLEKNTRAYSNDKAICKWEAAAKLSILGVGVSLDLFLDAASGGTFAAFSEIGADALIVGAVDIFHSYEECNGRVH